MNLCICSGKPGKFSVLLADGPNVTAHAGSRYFLPNQGAREFDAGRIPERWFCETHMRAVEDSLRATILYHQTENGVMLVAPPS